MTGVTMVTGADAVPTVLVVDGDPDLRTILQSVLVSEGYQVSTATDGEHALRHTERGLIDVIVMDVTMPHRTGLVTHLLRQRGDDSGQHLGDQRLSPLVSSTSSTLPATMTTINQRKTSVPPQTTTLINPTASQTPMPPVQVSG